MTLKNSWWKYTLPWGGKGKTMPFQLMHTMQGYVLHSHSLPFLLMHKYWMDMYWMDTRELDAYWMDTYWNDTYWRDAYWNNMCGMMLIDMHDMIYANNLLKNPATKRLLGKNRWFIAWPAGTLMIDPGSADHASFVSKSWAVIFTVVGSVIRGENRTCTKCSNIFSNLINLFEVRIFSNRCTYKSRQHIVAKRKNVSLWRDETKHLFIDILKKHFWILKKTQVLCKKELPPISPGTPQDPKKLASPWHRYD